MQQILINDVSLEELKDLLSNIIEEKLKSSLSPSDTPVDDEYLNRAEVAKMLRVSLPTLHNLTLRGVLIAYRIGRRVLYKRGEVVSSLSAIEGVKCKSKLL